MTVHNAAINLLKRDYPELLTRGFAKSIDSLKVLNVRRTHPCYPEINKFDEAKFEPEFEGDVPEIVDRNFLDGLGDRTRFPLIPDGFFLDFFCQMVVVFEVEDSNRLSIQKLSEYYYMYLDDLEPLGWGISLIAVDRWGKRSPVPLFDYVFSDRLGRISQGSVLAAIQHEMEIEHRYTIAASHPRSDWDLPAMFESLSDARVNTNHLFWRREDVRFEFRNLICSK